MRLQKRKIGVESGQFEVEGTIRVTTAPGWGSCPRSGFWKIGAIAARAAAIAWWYFQVRQIFVLEGSP
jgi:hypothetical protein